MSTAQYGSVRVTFGGGDATRAAPLQTEPTRYLREPGGGAYSAGPF